MKKWFLILAALAVLYPRAVKAQDTATAMFTIPVTVRTHSVTLNWGASPTTGVVGYRVWRSPNQCGAISSLSEFVLQNTTLISGLTTIDTAVTNGASYCYIVTAVDIDPTNGKDNDSGVGEVPVSAGSIPPANAGWGGFSNEAQTVIPTS